MPDDQKTDRVMGVLWGALAGALSLDPFNFTASVIAGAIGESFLNKLF